jgi:hypothetical protein
MAGDPALRWITTSEERQMRKSRTLEGPKPRVHLDHGSTRTHDAKSLTSET